MTSTDEMRYTVLSNSRKAALYHERAHAMIAPESKPRVTSFAPQFLVDDLARSIAYYQKLGFAFGEPWDGFYAIGRLDGLELHLKEAAKYDAERQHRREHEHLDAAAGVDGIEAFYAQCMANGARIIKPLTATAWGTKDFYVEDPDGYIVCFGGRPTAD
jgi:catechol 2,3-dioxygenase-like lactoylglutathione lyase family enzyme